MRGSGKVVERRFLLRHAVPLLFDMLVQGREIVCAQRLALPPKICPIAGEPPKPPLLEMDFEVLPPLTHGCLTFNRGCPLDRRFPTACSFRRRCPGVV